MIGNETMEDGIKAYRVELPLVEVLTSGPAAISCACSTRLWWPFETDLGITGYGEVCPLGAAYLPAYAAGATTGIGELAPSLIGLDPTELGAINRHMDRAMRGHPMSNRNRHGLLGYLGKSGQPAGGDTARRTIR